MEYVLSELQSLDSLQTWTQDVPLTVQVDDAPPQLLVKPEMGSNYTLQPRLEVATVSGSGSLWAEDARFIFVDSCAFNGPHHRSHPWVAVIDTYLAQPDCSYCERMLVAIREGGISFLDSTPD